MSTDTAQCKCPTCGKIVPCERTHNGIAEVWHAVHCGYGHEVTPLTQPCPNCYGGHFRPCQWCGDSGRVTFMQTQPTIECHGLDTTDRVCFYEQDFYVLSNFSSFRVKWKGLTFDTSEHAYHWEKFPEHPVLRNAVRDAASAHESLKIATANKALRRPDWDDVKCEIMKDILRAKLEQHDYVRRKLLATGDRELVENSWRDDFWGWGPNRDGQNELGKLWMELRAELQIDAMSPEEVKAFLHANGITDLQVETGLSKVRAMVEATLAKRAQR